MAYDMFNGAPDDADVPDFLRTGTMILSYIRQSVPAVVTELEKAPSDYYVQAADGSLIPFDAYQEARKFHPALTVKSSQLVRGPRPVVVGAVLGRYLINVPASHQETARQALLEGIATTRPQTLAHVVGKPVVTALDDVVRLLETR